VEAGRLGVLLLAGALVLGTGGAAFQGVAAATPSEEACFLASINATRTAAGVAPLTMNAGLSSIARGHSEQMASAGVLSHNANLPNQAPAGWVALGENVGAGPSCPAVTQLINNDPQHRTNILDPLYNTVGVGVVDTAAGTIYVTEDFLGMGAAAPAPPTADPVPARFSGVVVEPVLANVDTSKSQAATTAKAVLPPAANPHAQDGRGSATSRVPTATPIVVAAPGPLGMLASVVQDLNVFFAGLS